MQWVEGRETEIQKVNAIIYKLLKSVAFKSLQFTSVVQLWSD